MANSINLVYLHGFLGSPRDFALIEIELKKRGLEVNGWGPDFFNPGPCSAAHDFKEWTANFLDEVDRRFEKDRHLIIMGYSLGARLALHAFFAAPARFENIFMISANPGISFVPEAERRVWEAAWAKKFRESSWEDAFQAWNKQEVFNQTTPRIPPSNIKMQRDLVADSIARWSLFGHEYDQEDLFRLPRTTQWWFGEKDVKFIRVKDELERRQVPGEYRVVAGAGHRLTLDVPELLASAIQKTGGL